MPKGSHRGQGALVLPTSGGGLATALLSVSTLASSWTGGAPDPAGRFGSGHFSPVDLAAALGPWATAGERGETTVIAASCSMTAGCGCVCCAESTWGSVRGALMGEAPEMGGAMGDSSVAFSAYRGGWEAGRGGGTDEAERRSDSTSAVTAGSCEAWNHWGAPGGAR